MVVVQHLILVAAGIEQPVERAVGRQQGKTATQFRRHFSRANGNCRNSAALVSAND
jgi:hypothetical protein